MITHFLGPDEVSAYSRDLGVRLASLGPNFPTKWFPVGQSGEKIAAVVYDLLPPERRSQVFLTTAYCDRTSGEVRFEDSIDDVQFDEHPILVIDSAVHSGATMLKITRSLNARGAHNIISYALMLKRSSIMVPTYFGILVADKDRVYFQLESMPNNRLCERPPFGILRELSSDDIGKQIGEIGPPFEEVSIGALLYDKKTKGYHSYIYELGDDICGFVSFGKSKRTLFIDAWATTKKYRGKGIGDALLRWTETWARSNKCDFIKLWAFERAIETYVKYGYSFVGEETMFLSGSENYRLMRKPILYHTKVSLGLA